MRGAAETTSGGPHAFQSTHWSLVLAAAKPDSTEARQALAKLCDIYWYPIYAFIRRRGCTRDQAKDLTQELFARLIEKERFAVADPERGRFRSFLLACARHLLSQERKKEQAVKRGGNCSFVSLDEVLAEHRYDQEPSDNTTPEGLYERRWALTLLAETLTMLKHEYVEAGKQTQFDVMEPFLSGAKDAPCSYDKLAVSLQISNNAARQAVYRLRCRYGELLRSLVAQTVASPQDVQAELSHLLTVVSGGS